MFSKILIANRGEIAVRVQRTCREMGISTVAVFSDADRASLHVRMADEAVRIGPAPARQSYLSIDRLLEAAARTGADAVHPGYGFLSENPDFAEACARAGLRFIGPSPEAMRAMGSKTRARERMTAAGVPVVPGTTTAVTGREEAAAIAAEVGYPVMLKAAAGGGGKGMRLVAKAEDLPAALSLAQSEAESAFGDRSVYVEKAIVGPRHVEVQVLADEHGNCIHLGERECSLQRRHQKVIEESPSPLLDGYDQVREQVTAAAVRAAQAVGYSNAGTVELLMDADRNFYFLEMNTRLQVEHPVTELVTGLDLVREQIRIAAGEPLGYTQDDVRFSGWALECRVYAEDPAQGFLPSPGEIVALDEPAGPGVRLDSGVYEGWTVPIDYDPLLAKLCAWAPTRLQAIDRLRRAVGEYHVGGIETTLGFFRDVLEDEEFRRGAIDTGFIGRFLERRKPRGGEADDEVLLLAAAARQAAAKPVAAPAVRSSESGWKLLARQSSLRRP